MYRPADYSDSDDSDCLSDDGDYLAFKERRKLASQNIKEKELTQEEKNELAKKQFHSALVCSKNKEIILEFLNNGFDVNGRLQDDWTPLLLSVSVGSYDITAELLKRGATINNVRNGMTALMMACNCPKETSPFEESYKTIKILVENGANIKSINRKRMTALMFAANAGNLEAVKYLLPLSDKHAVDNQRWNALYWAVNGNSVNVVQYLLEEGLDYNSPDIRNNTPLDFARANGLDKIVNLFPQDEVDTLDNILKYYPSDYEEIIALKHNEKPQLFLDICSMLNAVRCESTIKTLSEKEIDLLRFLSSSHEELKNWGIKMPYQRERILGGLHKFHKYPYHPNSLHSIPLKEIFSNIDASIQLITIIKQLIAMEASLIYIRKKYHPDDVGEDQTSILKAIEQIKNRIKGCRRTSRKLLQKAKKIDSEIKPVDLITKASIKYHPPWRKIIFLSIISAITVIIKIRR